MSTDTALAVGLLALVGPQARGKMRAFLLTVLVVDDFVAFLMIVIAYSGQVTLLPVGIVAITFALLVAGLHFRVDLPPVNLLLGIIMWLAVLRAGVDPVVTGLAVGLTAWAY